MAQARPEVAVAATKPSKLTQLPAPSPLMKRLSAPLLALPAYQTGAVLADAPPTFTEVGLRYTHYSEDSIDQDVVIFGAMDRYDIDVTQLWIEAPLGASWSVALDVQNDYQTGASPWFVGAQQNGEPGVIMSGASIQDNRVEVGVTPATSGPMAMQALPSAIQTKMTMRPRHSPLMHLGIPPRTRAPGARPLAAHATS